MAEIAEKRLGREDAGEFAELGTRDHAKSEAKNRHALWEADEMNAEKHSAMTAMDRKLYQGINDVKFKAEIDAVGELPTDVVQATDTYCDVVMEKYLNARQLDSEAQLLLETRVSYEKWVPTGFGTADCIIVSDSMLEVCDYKNGTGVPVSAIDNPQIRLYALGAIDLLGDFYNFTQVRMTIIQPRLNSVTEEVIAKDELLKWADEYVAPRARAFEEGRGEFAPRDLPVLPSQDRLRRPLEAGARAYHGPRTGYWSGGRQRNQPHHARARPCGDMGTRHQILHGISGPQGSEVEGLEARAGP